MIRSRICDLLGIRYPVFQGGMAWIADGVLAAAVSEAVTNAIIHGYRENPAGTVYINVKICEERTLIIKVRDAGCGISDIRQAMTPLYSGDPSGERGGMGFSIMESFTDDLTVRSFIGKGTTVIMEKKFKE